MGFSPVSAFVVAVLQRAASESFSIDPNLLIREQDEKIVANNQIVVSCFRILLLNNGILECVLTVYLRNKL